MTRLQVTRNEKPPSTASPSYLFDFTAIVQMSGLHDLQGPISQIYHEKQQPGSMLCAQHALNNLLREILLLSRKDFLNPCVFLTEANYVRHSMTRVFDFNLQTLVHRS